MAADKAPDGGPPIPDWAAGDASSEALQRVPHFDRFVGSKNDRSPASMQNCGHLRDVEGEVPSEPDDVVS